MQITDPVLVQMSPDFQVISMQISEAKTSDRDREREEHSQVAPRGFDKVTPLIRLSIFYLNIFVQSRLGHATFYYK